MGVVDTFGKSHPPIVPVSCKKNDVTNFNEYVLGTIYFFLQKVGTKGQLIQQLDWDTFSLEHQSMGKLPLGQSIRSRLSGKAKALEHRKRKMDRNATYLKWQASSSSMGGFICTSPSWLSGTSSSSQCCWTRMASQMIEFYQFRCHFAEPQKR